VIARAGDSAREPIIAVTLGDVRGIGPEIVEKALAEEAVRASARFLLVGPSGTSLDVDESVGTWRSGAGADEAGKLAGRAIERAVELALNGEVHGIVTAPIDKAALFAGGYDFPGHTEMLAELTNSRVAMMLAATRPNEGMTNPLRVVLATTHMALRDVPAAINEGLLVDVADTTRNGLRDWFGIEHPRIALCAMNPHAGDGGRFGDEDERILTPAARRADLAGPFPADTVFVRAMRGAFDAVIAPYHDVGMTAIKVAAFGNAVNVTLGLPFPRTSPDHGTALDIAGRGIADASSMIEAMILGASIAARQKLLR
jgi:4-hydroxythreonine-4-phosphate dehydrogenase